MLRVDKFAPKTPEESIVKMIATGSDVLAAWDRKIQESRGRSIRKDARNARGENVGIPITYNQGVIDVALAACRSFERQRSFFSELEDVEMPDDYLVGLARSMAERLQL